MQCPTHFWARWRIDQISTAVAGEFAPTGLGFPRACGQPRSAGEGPAYVAERSSNRDWSLTEVSRVPADLSGYGGEHLITGSEQEILSRSSSLSRWLWAMEAALSNSARASSLRPRRSSRSPRTLGSKW